MTRRKKNLSVLDIAQGKLPRSERKDVEPAGDRLMIGAGFTSIHFSQSRATMQTPGIADRRYYHPNANGLYVATAWWEAKAEDGKQNEAEWKFQQLVESCREVYLLGTEEVLEAWLKLRCVNYNCTPGPWAYADVLQPEQYRYKPPKESTQLARWMRENARDVSKPVR